MGERSDYQNQGGTLTRYCKGWVTLSNACTRGGYVEDYKCLIGFFGRLCGTRVDYIQTKQHTVRALKFNIRILKQGDAAPGLSTNGCPTVNLFWKLDLVPVMIHLEVGPRHPRPLRQEHQEKFPWQLPRACIQERACPRATHPQAAPACRRTSWSLLPPCPLPLFSHFNTTVAGQASAVEACPDRERAQTPTLSFSPHWHMQTP